MAVEWAELNRQVIEEFRANGGKVGGPKASREIPVFILQRC